jgi:hypothetical protein
MVFNEEKCWTLDKEWRREEEFAARTYFAF